MFPHTRCLGVLLCLSLPAIPLKTGAAPCFNESAQFGLRATIAVAWGDADKDGDLDLAVGNYLQANQLFINNGDGSFTEQAQFGSGATFAVAWGDYDNDGDSDLAVGRGNGQQNYLYINNGDGTFAQQMQFGLSRTNAVAWGDYDNDGDLDLAVGNGLLGVPQQNHLFVNNGNGTFSQQNQFGLGQSASVVWGDYDNDGDLDLAVGNGGFGFVGQNYLFVNNGDGTFTERPEFGLGDTACLAWGDCDNDGDLDMAVGNWNAGQCYLYVNAGDGTFTPQAQFGARDTNSLSWGDADNDGDLDLAVGNGDFESADSNYIYDNTGDGSFLEVAQFGQGSTDAVVWGDSDNDGDLDLAVGNEHTSGQNYLYVNCQPPGATLIVDLIGHFHDRGVPYSNRDAVGAKVSVYEAGFLGDPAHLLGYREISENGGFSSQSAREAHFGLPGAAAVDLRIRWPGSGGSHFVQDQEGVLVGHRLTVEESAPASDVVPHTGISGRTAMFRATPNPTNGTVKIDLTTLRGRTSQLEICNILGRVVQVLRLEGPDGAGRYGARWDGTMLDGRPASAGVYLVRKGGMPAQTLGKILIVR